MSSHDAIGGYFGLELKKGTAFYSDLLALNSGRNALEYILQLRKYEKVYIPYFTCDVVLEPFRKLNIDFEFYHINSKFEPESLPDLSENEGFLYTNYFSLKSEYIQELKATIGNIIIDNAQAFFSQPDQNVDTFYSPRKFFGLPDGAYVSLKNFEKRTDSFEKDLSTGRFEHLIMRLDVGAEAGYNAFKRNDESLIGNPIREMSDLTKALLKGIDYDNARLRRNQNFTYLHSKLIKYNEIDWIDIKKVDGPLVYPFCLDHPGLKDILIANKIFVATYWPNVFNWVSEEDIEFYLTKSILSLPVDHRYGLREMDLIVELILKSL